MIGLVNVAFRFQRRYFKDGARENRFNLVV
jgi:hypothetical protein